MAHTLSFWNLSGLTNAALLGGLSRLVGSSRRLRAEVVAHLAEVEERRLHLDSGYGSMFSYCVSRLGLSEDEAYRRIEVARVARRYPDVYPLLASGQLSLSAVTLLKPYLTDAHSKELFALVSGKSVNQARELLAARFPRPDVPSKIRKLPSSQLAPPRTDEEDDAVLPLLSFSGACQPHSSSVSSPAAGLPDAEPSSSPGPANHLQPGGSSPGHARAAGPALSNASPSDASPSDASPSDAPPSAALPSAALPSAALPSAALPSAALPSDAPWSDALRSNNSPSESPSRNTPPRAWPAAAPSPTPNLRNAPPVRPAKTSRVIEPLSEARYKIQLTADAALKGKLELARDLMRHTISDGDFAPILSRALDLLIEQLMKRRFGARSKHRAAPSDHGSPKGAPSNSTVEVAHPSAPDAPSAPASATPPTADPKPASPMAHRINPAARSRPRRAEASIGAAPEARRATKAHTASISRSTRRTVSERDDLRCTWQSADGVRCGSRAWLEYDHTDPRGRGGGREPANVRLLCRAHNQRAAEHQYGRSHMADAITRAKDRRSPTRRAAPESPSPAPPSPLATPPSPPPPGA